jgi:hypothetical protein
MVLTPLGGALIWASTGYWYDEERLNWGVSLCVAGLLEIAGEMGVLAAWLLFT